jgi:cob(I)alamin adenosyltransferase
MRKDVTQTHLLDRTLVDKDSDVMWGVGTLDEANSFIGLARVHARDSTVREYLERIQYKMFKAGTEFVSDQHNITEEDYSELMEMIKHLESVVRRPRSFILLEKNESGAFLSVARSVVRRAERVAVGLQKSKKVSKLLVEWLNKLSYLLYLMNLIEIDGDYDEIK